MYIKYILVDYYSNLNSLQKITLSKSKMTIYITTTITKFEVEKISLPFQSGLILRIYPIQIINLPKLQKVGKQDPYIKYRLRSGNEDNLIEYKECNVSYDSGSIGYWECSDNYEILLDNYIEKLNNGNPLDLEIEIREKTGGIGDVFQDDYFGNLIISLYEILKFENKIYEYPIIKDNILTNIKLLIGLSIRNDNNNPVIPFPETLFDLRNEYCDAVYLFYLVNVTK